MEVSKRWTNRADEASQNITTSASYTLLQEKSEKSWNQCDVTTHYRFAR